MIVASRDATASLPQELAERLAESLRAPGAFAVDADTGAPVAPAGAALDEAARDALVAFARDQRGTAATLLDLPLDGAAAPATPSACRILPLEGRRRVVIVVPIDGGAHDTAARAAAPPAEPEGPPVRILWQSDSEGHITHIGEQLRRMMGDQAGAVAGRRWADLIGDVMLDPADEIVRALNRRETASGVELLWSSDREAGPATLLWSGVPVFDSGRRFRGFRGFLLAPARLARAAEAQPAPEPEAAPAQPSAATQELVVAPREPAIPAASGEPAIPLIAPALAAEASAAQPAENSAATRPAPSLPSMPHLSSAERNAFREIARALGVRGMEEAEQQAPQPTAPPARPELRLVSSTPAREEDRAPPAPDEPQTDDASARADEAEIAEEQATVEITATHEAIAVVDDASQESTADPAPQQSTDASADLATRDDDAQPAPNTEEIATLTESAEDTESVEDETESLVADEASPPTADQRDAHSDDAVHAADTDASSAVEDVSVQPDDVSESGEPEIAEDSDATPADDDLSPAADEAPPPPANDSAPPPDFETIQARVAALAASLAQNEKQERGENRAAAAPLAASFETPAQTADAAPLAASLQRPAPFATPLIAPVTPSDPLLPHARDILDRIPVGVLVNRGSALLFANRTLMDLLDYPSIASIEAHGGVAGLFKGRAPISDRDGPTGPVLLNTRDGDSIAVDARLQGIDWGDGPATLVTFRRALDVEISQRLKATELDLRAREAELRETRAVLDTATDGVAVIDEDGRIMTLNRTAEALFGYEQNEVAGESITTLFAPESHAQAGDYFEGLKSGGVRSVLNDGREIIGRVRQGGRIPLFVTFGQISDRPSRKFCAVMRDLTHWKKTERDLIDARKAAEDASAQKSDFLAKISHEVRTPLNAIIGFAEVMMEERFGPVGNDRYKDYLRDIHASGGHVISLVNDLLDLSKIEAGKMELDFVSVGVNEIIRGAVNLMQPQSQRARVVVRSALAGKLPAVVADERSLKQIIINLLSNAVKFTDSGGQVIVSTTLTDLGEVAIRIRDTGIGMTEKELSEAMEPFRQLATSRRAGGTGLGLPLTRALVEANRAHLKLSSVKNEGTLVEVVFPPTRVLAE